MSRRRLLVPVWCDTVEPVRLIVGVRTCPPHYRHTIANMLAAMHADCPGWDTLSVCDQYPARFGKTVTLRSAYDMPGITCV